MNEYKYQSSSDYLYLVGQMLVKTTTYKDVAEDFQIMENICAVYIEKQYEALTIYNNEFKANMGMFGAAITLNNVADGLDVA